MIFAPAIDCERGVLLPALVDLHLVELDDAVFDVLGAFDSDFGLEGHLLEGFVVDKEDEFVLLHVVVQRQLPFEFVILQCDRKCACLCEFFPMKLAQKE